MHYIYSSVFVEYVTKNPLYEPGKPFKCAIVLPHCTECHGLVACLFSLWLMQHLCLSAECADCAAASSTSLARSTSIFALWGSDDGRHRELERTGLSATCVELKLIVVM